MKALRLKESCTQYTVSRNRYGDTVLTTVGSLLCLFRDISTLTESTHHEGRTISGIFWFDPASSVKIGDVVGYNGTMYRIETVNNAKGRLTNDALHFIKCNVSILRQIS